MTRLFSCRSSLHQFPTDCKKASRFVPQKRKRKSTEEGTDETLVRDLGIIGMGTSYKSKNLWFVGSTMATTPTSFLFVCSSLRWIVFGKYRLQSPILVRIPDSVQLRKKTPWSMESSTSLTPFIVTRDSGKNTIFPVWQTQCRRGQHLLVVAVFTFTSVDCFRYKRMIGIHTILKL